MKTMKDYCVIRKYYVLIINEKERLNIRSAGNNMPYYITLELTNCLIFFAKHILS